MGIQVEENISVSSPPQQLALRGRKCNRGLSGKKKRSLLQVFQSWKKQKRNSSKRSNASSRDQMESAKSLPTRRRKPPKWRRREKNSSARNSPKKKRSFSIRRCSLK